MLVSLAANYSICFSKQQRISKDRFKDDDYDIVVRTIAEKTDVKGISRILFFNPMFSIIPYRNLICIKLF